jgi:hypothetical protein
MNKYVPLYKWLSTKSDRGISRVFATFEEIEKVLGFKLPVTARKKSQWWGNEISESRHVQCKVWLDADFETRNLDLSKESVEFVKILSH